MTKQDVFKLFDDGWSIDGVIRMYWSYSPVIFVDMWREWYESRKHKVD